MNMVLTTMSISKPGLLVAAKVAVVKAMVKAMVAMVAMVAVVAMAAPPLVQEMADPVVVVGQQ